jgi:hypothetical protein
MIVRRRRKLRGDPGEMQVMGRLAAADQLHEWARTIHKRPPLTEVEGAKWRSSGGSVNHSGASAVGTPYR